MKTEQIKSKILDTVDRLIRTANEARDANDWADCISATFQFTNTAEINDLVLRVLKEKGLNVFTVTPTGYEIANARETVTIDNYTASHLAPTAEQIDLLDKADTVLFLKDLDKMSDLKYRRLLFDFINSHIVADNRQSQGFTQVNNMLFAVATIGDMSARDFYIMDTMDAKNVFMTVDLNADK